MSQQSTSEVGHVKNVANFEDLLSFCKAYGARYAPSNDRLKLPNLTSLLETAQSKIKNVHTRKTTFDLATDARRKEFEPLKKLSTKIVNALAVSGVNDLIIKDAKTINNKIQGKTAKPKTKENEANQEVKESISISQQSYDRLIDHFSALIELLAQNPLYQPNEPELKLKNLNENLTKLKALNTNLIDAYTHYSNAMLDRNKLFYNELTGLVTTSKEVKLYVRSLYGYASQEYKQVSGIQIKLVKSR